jgi:dimethylamine monooxygenase subunit A
MGTRAEAAPVWSRDPEQLAEKDRLLATVHDEVVVRRPRRDAEGVDARAAAVVAPGCHRLEDAARLVAEDLCVLTRDAGRWLLTSGVICFPSRWRPADKLGRPVAEIHGPVPAYDTELAPKVDRFLDALRPGRVGAWRRNWLVHDDPALHQPVAPPPPKSVDVPDGLWLRSERQALHAVPGDGPPAVLFTIRTEQVPLAEVVADRPDVARRLGAAMAAWSPELVAYRGATAWHAEAVAVLGDA